MSEEKPEFVYRLATRAEWAAAQDGGLVPLRDIDEQDGYVHLSTREQALDTANIHFAGVADLLALEIPLAPIDPLVKFELAPKRGQSFPHLYGRLETRHVARAIALEAGPEGFRFGGAL